MVRVKVEVEETTVQGDFTEVDGLVVTCDKYGYQIEVGGIGNASAKAAGAKLRMDCPQGETNFYEVEEAMTSYVDPDL